LRFGWTNTISFVRRMFELLGNPPGVMVHHLQSASYLAVWWLRVVVYRRALQALVGLVPQRSPCGALVQLRYDTMRYPELIPC
jgi:hypothetical protein